MSAEKPPVGLSKREQLARLLEKRAARPRQYPLSFAQQRLWFLDRLSPGNPAYNVSLVLGMPRGLRREVLAAALRELVRRHGALRTRFAEVDGEPVQLVAPAGEPAAGAEVRVLDLSGLPDELRQGEAARAANSEIHAPFDLERGPLLRITWIERGPGQIPALLVVLHHIVADGWSADVLMRETLSLCTAFAAERPSPLPELPVQYGDYVLAQRQWLQGEVLEEQIAFWRDRLAGVPPLELPADRPRPPVQTFRGTTEMVWLSPGSTAAVRALAQRAGATPFMLLLAAFQAFLFRYAGQEVLAVGSPVAGRNRRELEGLIGLFVNMVVLRADLGGDPAFEGFLDEVRRWTAAALSHQETPFEKLVEALQPERDPSRTPLFQAAFVLQGGANAAFAPDARIPDLESSVSELGSRETSKFDLTLELVDRGEIFSGVLELNLDLFDAETGRRMGRHFKNLLEAALGAPETRLSELPLLDKGERSQILHVGQPTLTPTADPRSLCDLFAEQAVLRPDAPAVTFDGETLSYGELSARADRLAAVLRSLGVGPEQVVGLFAERSARLVVGILGILRAGGAYLPLDPGYPAERLAYLLDDSGTRLIVVDEPLRGRLPGEGRTEISLQESTVETGLSAPAPLPVNPDHLAYVIYTSGSTGQPKGALLTHANVVRLLTGTTDWFGFGPDDVWTLFHSFAFDFSVWEIWGTLAFGGSLVVVPQAVSREPGAFLELLRRERVTVLNQTPSAFRQLVRAAEEEEVDPAALALRWVIFGGEALEPAALAPWIERAGDERPRLVNMYGITETTVHVTWRPLTAADLRRADRSPIGAAIPDLSLHVLDGNLKPVPPGVAGELAVGGAGLARGYLGRPGLTAARFVPDPHSGLPGARLYRSGDLARRLGDGEVVYSGRIDHQVKIRGFRIEPGEIEAAIATHPRVREAVVLVREDVPGDRRLIGYFVASSPTPPSGRELRQHLQGRLPEHMVPAAFMALESWPLTVNGKLDRQALPSPEWGGERETTGTFVAPRDPVDEMLAGIWSEVLKVPRVGIDDDFFALGGHSLLATQVTSRIRATLGVVAPLHWLFEQPTVRGLAARVAPRLGETYGGGAAAAPPLVPVPRSRTGMPLSYAQERLWFLDRLQPGPLYNIAAAVRLQGSLNEAALHASFRTIAARHEALRTTFPEVEGAPVQRIAAPADLPMPRIDLDALPEPLRRDEARRRAAFEGVLTFDLEAGPLFRILLLRLAADEHVLLLTLHHIVADGWSTGVLTREIAALYRAAIERSAAPLPELPVQYADYSAWQRAYLTGAVLEEQLGYWRRRLAGAPEALELPTDRPRRPIQRLRGGGRTRVLSPELSQALVRLARAEGATPFMVLLAGFQVLLLRYTGQEDLVVGTPVAGRSRAEIEGLIGLFLNTLALRGDLSGDPAFRVLLAGLRKLTLADFAHQDLPFEKVVEDLAPQRDLSRSPLFQAMLVLQNTPAEAVELPGLRLAPVESDETSTKFDLTLVVMEAGDRLIAGLGYDRDLFDAESIERMLVYFERLLAGVAANPGRRLSELPLLADDERLQILRATNPILAVKESLPRDPRCLHDLFAEQVVRRPDAPAVTFEGETLSYGEVNARANRLATTLRGLGVGPERIVGLFARRSAGLVTGILGILKAGGAYLPLDPSYPDERLSYLLTDSGARVAVVEEVLRGRLPAEGIVEVSLEGGENGAAPPIDTASPAPDNLAYVIYTSGSTGRPKGSLITHANVVRLLTATAGWFGFGEGDVWTLFHSFAFDFSVWEIWGALAFGGRLVVVPRPVSREPEAFLELLRRERVTVLNQTPSAFRQLAAAVLADAQEDAGLALREVIFGGEALEPAALAAWIDRFGDESPHLVNMYGITETTVHVTFRPMDAADLGRPDRSPIGRPIPDLAVHVLDRNLEPVPPGVAGEIVVGGEGLARGYLGRPDLTAARFVPDPHSTVPGTRIYRSGDLARRLADGELVYGGRADHQVKVRGFRIEPGEIEAALAAHPEVREAVVLVREDTPGDRRLVAYVVPTAGSSVAAPELCKHLQGRLPEHLVPAAFVTLEALPLTVNGKLDRKALPAPAWGDAPGEAGSFVHPRDPVEEVLAGIWAEVLRVPCIGIDDDFFALGGHSLLATQVVSRVRTSLGVTAPLPWLFERPTVRGFAARVAPRLAEADGLSEAPPVVPVPRTGEGLPLSYAQERLWFLHQLEPHSPAYNIAAAVRLSGRLRAGDLVAALTAVATRHEALRTSFPAVLGEPVQRIAPPASFPLPLVDLAALGEPERESEALRFAVREAHRPFDLKNGPVLRAVLVRLEEEEHALLLTVHHIAADGWSMGILIRELTALYTFPEAPLPALAVQYADFAVWQRERLQGETLEAQLRYWRERLAAAPAELDLPADRPRPPVPSGRGGLRNLLLPAERTAALAALGRREGATLFMVLLAGFDALLHRLTGRDDLILGTDVAGRNRAEIEPLIGFFVNQLVLRVDLSGDPPFRALLARAREAALGAYAHQDLPFGKLVEEIRPGRDLSRTPLFQVLFSLHNLPPAAPALAEPAGKDRDGLGMRTLPGAGGNAKFDLAVEIAESPAGLIVSAEYSSDLFDPPTVDRLLGSYEILLAAVLERPDFRISRLPLLREAERHQLLAEWNDSAALFPGDLFHTLFDRLAEAHSTDVAATCQGEALTYGELRERSDRLARALVDEGLGLDGVAALLADRGLPFLTAMIGVFKAGGAYLPLDPLHPAPRLARMLAGSGARLAVAERRFFPVLEEALAALPVATRPRLLELEELLARADRPAALPQPSPSGLAYVIFTSGSTGAPKGAMVEHRGMLNHLWAKVADLGLTAADTVAQTASQGFDISVWQFLAALLVGGRTAIFPDEIAHDPARLAEATERDGVTVLETVPSLLRFLVEELDAHRGERPGLAALRWMIPTGEALPPELCRQWLRLYPRVPLLNAYGPTECSDDVTHHLLAIAPGPAEAQVPIGRPVANLRLYVVDRDGELLPAGVPGELRVGGAGVGRGYRLDGARTAEVFVPDPFAAEPGARLYRTGDLGRQRSDGTIDFLGRLDHQVKIRGHRIELGEVEAALAAHPEVRQAVALAPKDSSDARRLVACLVCVPGTEPSVSELRSFVETRLPDAMVPAAFLLLPELPLTPNGKVDRRALEARAAEASERASGPDAPDAAPRTPLETDLARIWAEVLRLPAIGLDDDFFLRGGHSLLATQVISRIQRDLRPEPPIALRAVFDRPTVRAMAEWLAPRLGDPETGRPAAALSIPRVPRTGDLPLSFAQQRLWFLDRLQPGLATYNVPAAVRLLGNLDEPALHAGFTEIVRRHEALRTTFPSRDGRPVQGIGAPGELPMPRIDLHALPEPIRTVEARRLANAEAARPFDLAAGPLFRVTLLRLAPAEHTVLVTLHHIVSDGWSAGVLTREVAALYRAAVERSVSPLPELPIQYADYAAWQRDLLSGESLERQLGYWRARLAGIPDALELPTDRPRRAVQRLRGGGRGQVLSPELMRALRYLAQAEGATLFMPLLAGFQALLQRYTGQDDVVVGTPVAGRSRVETEGLIGFFVNTLALRGDLSDDPSFRSLLARIRESTLGDYAHQDVPFERLVEELAPHRDLSRAPLFQVMLVLQNAPAEPIELPGLTLAPVEVNEATTKFDLTLLVSEVGDRLVAGVGYDRDLFDDTTAMRLLGHFEVLLEAAAARPGRRLSELPLLTAAEEQQTRSEWNDTRAAGMADRWFHELFEDRATSDPDRIAVETADLGWTYRELNARADRLARRLRALGAGADVVIGLLTDRTPEMLLGLLGVLKAGAAFLPLDPAYPTERLAFLVEDSGAPFVLAAAAFTDTVAPGLPAPSLMLDLQDEGGPQDAGTEPLERADGDSVAYVIYTSGSTGRPKGVMVSHRALANLSSDQLRRLDLEPGRRTTLTASPSFDASLIELNQSLLTGATIRLFPGEPLIPGLDLARRFRDARLDLLYMPTAVLSVMPAEGLERITCVTFGGEACPPSLAARWAPGRQIYDAYGPTEATIYCTLTRQEAGERITIGRPMANVEIHLLDPHLRPVPAGARGELYIGGAGLARGYLRRPNLTAEKFVPDPLATWRGEPGARLYRTGDLARWLADGRLDFLGRTDDQMKVRGYRIELGEIEEALALHPDVEQGAVVARPDRSGQKILTAYAVPRRPDLQAAEVRQYLAERLPAHMVPASFQLLAAMPRTANGKVDRKALAAPAPAKAAAGPGDAASDLERAVAAIWRDLLETDQFGLDDNFFDVGGHSLRLVEVQARLQQLLGREVPVVDLFRFPTIRSLAAHLSASQKSAREAEVVRPEPTMPAGRTDIAVIGMAGRFPGAADVEAFWDNLCRGVESISRFSEEELLAAGVDPAVLADPTYVPAGVVLEGIDQFDAEFFGYSPREAEVMDPQQRLFLQCAWHALENAGHDPRRVRRPVGVYAGALMSTYALNLLSRPEILAAVGGVGVQTGIDKDYIATRVSYELGLKGPSLTVQTACSTSLVAIHLACQALRLGECDMALAGGSNVRLPQGVGYLYQEGGINSPDGHCRAFDARARGTVAGNAVAVVVLKRLEDALRDGDTVHAVVKGSALNNDGSLKVGFTAPSVDGQAGVIAAAQAAAGVSPASIGYIEAHGTGTTLGDPIEVAALTRAFRLGGDHEGSTSSCALGSLKTNVGHLDAAAGVAGFLKAVYAVERGLIPPSLHFEEPNPKIDFASSPFRVAARLEDWPRGAEPRRAGVSSFGIGGTNAHVVLEEPPAPLPTGVPRPFQLLLLSARTATALDEASDQLAAHLSRPELADPAALADAAFTLQVGRAVFEHRRALVADTAGTAAAALAGRDRERILTARRAAGRSPAGIAFLFPGQGSQHPGMARGLYETEPFFRSLVDEGAEKLAPLLGLDLRQVLFPPAGGDEERAAAALRETRLAQPALFVIEHALARLWMSWGIVPRAMIGHSLGEYVAACLAGVFSFDDALGLVADRGERMQALPSGAMLSVELGEEELRHRTAGSQISVAAINGPALCVASGLEDAVEDLARQLESEGISCQRLHTSHAFHSDAMDPILGAFEERVARIPLSLPTLPFVSNLTGDWITAEQATSPAYWAEHLRGAVRFGQGIETLLTSAPEEGSLVLLEVGPGKALGSLARSLAQSTPGVEVVSSMRHPREEGHDVAVLLGALARLWMAGSDVDWAGFRGGERRRRMPLPGYPFQTRRFWVDPARGRSFERERSDSALYAPVWKGAPALPTAAPGGSGSWVFAVEDPAFAELSASLAGVLRETGIAVETEGGDTREGTRIACFGPSLSALLRLARSRPEAEIVLVTAGVQAVTAAESERQEDARPAALAGLARSLRCRSVDVQIPAAGWKQDRLAQSLAAELLSGPAGTAVAYRDGERWIEIFEPIPASPAAPWLAKGDLCVWRGAATPLAGSLAERLDREFGAHVAGERHGQGDALLYWIDAVPGAAEGEPKEWAHELSRVLSDLTALEEALRREPVRACLVLTSTGASLGDPGQALGAALAAAVDAFVRTHNQREPAPWMRASLDDLDAMPAELAGRALRQLFALDPASRVVVSVLPPRARVVAANLAAESAGAEVLSGHERPELDTPFEAPREGTEQRLAAIWGELLGIAEVGLHDDFFELGGHSLMATRLISRIRETFGRELPLEAIFQAPTVARLAARINAEEGTASVGAVAPVPRDGALPLSYAQQRLLFLDVMSPGDVSYNLCLALRLQGRIEPSALSRAVDRLVERHEVLRTTFTLDEGKAAQIIAPAAPVPMPFTDLGALPAAVAEGELRRLVGEEAHLPIDLFRGPVLRARLVRRLPEEHALLLTVHHIAADGWSFGILYRELAEFYEAAVEGRAPGLPKLPVQYADFAAWQRRAPQQESLERQIDYWRERLAGAPMTELPGDRPRPPVRSGRGADHPVAFPAPLAETLRWLGRERDATPFMTLVSAFLALMHYYLRGNDLVVGTDLANRTRSETEGLIGLFVNQLVLRNDLSGDPSFQEILDRVRRGTLEAYAHQDAPFDRLVEVLNPVRDMSRTPLFQIKIVLQNTPMEARALPELVISPLGFEQRTAKFDLLLNLNEGPTGIQGRVEYTTDLYDPATIARLVERFGNVLETVAARPDIRLSEIVADLAERDQREQSQFLQEHRQARSRTVERVRRKAIPVTS